MHISMSCGYCGHQFAITFKAGVETYYGEAREFVKVNCPNCNSRHALDLKVRKKGKSAAIKKKEKAAVEAAERDLKARYEGTADALLKPWSSLTAEERRQAFWKLGHRG